MGYTLLVADDERRIREGILCSCDWRALGIEEVLTVADGREALELLGARHADILLSDIVMPEIDGLELCRLLHLQRPHLLLYLLTGHSDFEYARQAMRSGVQDYILKPVDSAELAAAMEKAVQELDRRMEVLRQAERLEELEENLPEEVREAVRAFIDDAMSDWPSPPSARRDGAGKSAAPSNPAIRQVLDYVEEHLADEELSLGLIAGSHLFLNADYLGKLFKKEMGMRFSTYVLDRRMGLAMDYIARHPDARVYEIAEAVGFGGNSSYFSALFRKVAGKGPAEYASQFLSGSRKNP